MKNQEKKYTVVEASRICGVTRSTVWRWIKTGQLDAGATAGGHHRIDESVLNQFMIDRKMVSSRRTANSPQILIVDDDISIQKYFRKLLSKEKFQLHFASDGFEAGMKAIQHLPDLVILDLFMPECDGFKVCRQIRDEKKTQQIKIIAISGYDSEENRLRILQAGADCFCPKPIDSKKFIEEINRLI